MSRDFPPVSGGTASGYTVRTAINAVLEAIRSCWSGAGDDATAVVGQIWHNTTTDTHRVKQTAGIKTLATTDMLTSGTGRLIGYQVFSASGSYTKGTNNPSFVIVEVQGAGASGAVAVSTTGPRLATGGGAGGYALKKINAAALAASETVTVGSGGAAVTSSGANGNNGGTSSFGSHCSATGGLAGAFKNSTGPLTGSLGGSASGGDVNSLGGGSSALFAAGTEFNAACGGSSRFGGGGAAIASTLGTTQTGIAGGIGAGGGGTVVNNSTAGHSSGKGGDGLVIVWEYA